MANEFTKELKDLLYDVEVVRNIVRATVSDKILKGLIAWLGGGGGGGVRSSGDRDGIFLFLEMQSQGQLYKQNSSEAINCKFALLGSTPSVK